MLRTHLRRAALGLATTLAAVLIGICWILPSLGNALVAEQTLPQQVDAILMLAAGPLPWSRLLETTSQARRYPESIILITQTQATPSGSGNPESDPPFQEQTRRAFIRLGIPARRLFLMPDLATSTVSELCVVRPQAARQGFRTLLLVTDRAHSARALAAAHAVLSDRLVVGMVPSRFDTFRPDTWWMISEERKTALVEFAKWLNFFQERFLAHWSWGPGSTQSTPEDRLCRVASPPP